MDELIHAPPAVYEKQNDCSENLLPIVHNPYDTDESHTNFHVYCCENTNHNNLIELVARIKTRMRAKVSNYRKRKHNEDEHDGETDTAVDQIRPDHVESSESRDLADRKDSTDIPGDQRQEVEKISSAPAAEDIAVQTSEFDLERNTGNDFGIVPVLGEGRDLYSVRVRPEEVFSERRLTRQRQLWCDNDDNCSIGGESSKQSSLKSCRGKNNSDVQSSLSPGCRNEVDLQSMVNWRTAAKQVEVWRRGLEVFYDAAEDLNRQCPPACNTTHKPGLAQFDSRTAVLRPYKIPINAYPYFKPVRPKTFSLKDDRSSVHGSDGSTTSHGYNWRSWNPNLPPDIAAAKPYFVLDHLNKNPHGKHPCDDARFACTQNSVTCAPCQATYDCCRYSTFEPSPCAASCTLKASLRGTRTCPRRSDDCLRRKCCATLSTEKFCRDMCKLSRMKNKCHVASCTKNIDNKTGKIATKIKEKRRQKSISGKLTVRSVAHEARHEAKTELCSLPPVSSCGCCSDAGCMREPSPCVRMNGPCRLPRMPTCGTTNTRARKAARSRGICRQFSVTENIDSETCKNPCPVMPEIDEKCVTRKTESITVVPLAVSSSGCKCYQCCHVRSMRRTKPNSERSQCCPGVKLSVTSPAKGRKRKCKTVDSHLGGTCEAFWEPIENGTVMEHVWPKRTRIKTRRTTVRSRSPPHLLVNGGNQENSPQEESEFSSDGDEDDVDIDKYEQSHVNTYTKKHRARQLALQKYY